MTDQTTICPNCQEPVPAGSRVCPSCQAVVDGDAPWPTWHGAPDTVDHADGEWKTYEDPAAADDYEKLALDPSLVNTATHQPGRRSWVGLWAVSAVVWLLVSRMYVGEHPAAVWDYVWYAAALLTLGLGVWLVVELVRRARGYGFGAALRWLVS